MCYLLDNVNMTVKCIAIQFNESRNIRRKMVSFRYLILIFCNSQSGWFVGVEMLQSVFDKGREKEIFAFEKKFFVSN